MINQLDQQLMSEYGPGAASIPWLTILLIAALFLGLFTVGASFSGRFGR